MHINDYIVTKKHIYEPEALAASHYKYNVPCLLPRARKSTFHVCDVWVSLCLFVGLIRLNRPRLLHECVLLLEECGGCEIVHVVAS